MAKIDRLGWADGMSFTSYGVRIGVRVNDTAILSELSARLPPGAKAASFAVVDHLYSIIGSNTKSGSKVRRLSLAYWNLLRFARSREFEGVLDAFESHVQLTVAEYAPRRIFVHAGVVGWNDRAILIPGLSHSGKTTLVDQLIRAGATYYSDEYAVIDERGRVHPYPRALGMRGPGSEQATKVRAEDIGATVGLKPLRVGLVVSTNYKDGARWRPRQVTRGKGVLELMSNTVSARSQPELALTALPAALESARILKGVRGEAAEIVDSILAQVT
ncbi:MAG: hypothetical protein QOH70_3731 [Blastocatellia bacterium]|jgi:hypothetical protein|nr:hypothetical protein [Blastocatellia bacterium]